MMQKEMSRAQKLVEILTQRINTNKLNSSNE